MHNTVDDAEWTCVYHLNHNALHATLALVGHDCIQPASEEIRVSELIEATICLQEDLLGDVLCIGLVPRLLKSVGVDHLLIFVRAFRRRRDRQRVFWRLTVRQLYT